MIMHRHSFTLLEVLMSIGIILVLAAITFGGMNYASKRAQEAKTIATMEEFISALEAFKQDYGFYPIIASSNFDVNLNDDVWDLFMNEKSGVTNKKNRAYMEGNRELLVDAYGQAFQYRCPGVKNTAKYDLWSKGPDKSNGIKNGTGAQTQPGYDGSDDICSWKQR